MPDPELPIPKFETAEDVQEKREQRVMRKAKAGKKLTERDRDTLAGLPSRDELKRQRSAMAAKKKEHLIERAEFWSVRTQTMYRLILDRVPVDSVEEMAKWYDGISLRAQSALAPAMKQRLKEERAKLGGVALPKEVTLSAQEEQAEFERSYVPGGTAVQENLAELMREKAFYLFRMRKARTANDPQKENEAAKSYRQFSDLVHDCELRLRKLGRDTGDLVAKSEVEFHLNFVAYHLLLCMDAATEAVVSGFKRMGPNASEHRQRQLVFEAFGPTKFFEPYYRAAEGTNAAAPPEWLINGLKAGAAAVIEENAKAGKVI